MLKILNDNQGAAMVLLTFIYVGATALLVWFALRQAKLTENSLKLLQEAERNRYRPYVIFDITFEDMIAYAVVKNTGISPALNVKICVTPELRWDRESEELSFVKDGIAFLAPNREIFEPFCGGKDFYDRYTPFVFCGTVSYADAAGIKFEETFRIDVSYATKMSKVGEVDVPKQVEKIREALEALVSSDFQPLVRVIREQEFREGKEEERQRRRATYEKIKAQTELPKGEPEIANGLKS